LTDTPTPKPPTELVPSKDDKLMAVLAHLSGLLFGPIIALVIWVVKKDESSFVGYHAFQAMLFHGAFYVLMIIIAGPISIITCGIGLLGIFIVWPLQWVGAIVYAIKANDGKMAGYPLLEKYGRPGDD